MELSSSFEANAGSNINRAEHTDQAIPGMDPKFYEAAAKGNNGVFENISDPLDRFLTVNKNTILHICISSIHVEEDLAGGTDPASAEKFVKYVHDKCPSTLSLKANAEEETALAEERTSVVGGTDLASAEIFVKYVLDKCPSLSLKANAEEETALHIAARYGHVSIVEVLIEHEKSQLQDLKRGVAVESSTATEMLIGRVNKEKDTALHEAVRNNHVKVVKLLLEIGPEFSYGANAAGETPLYLAAERHFPDLVFEILQTKSPAYDGPLGRTALHAAAFYDGEEITKNILERYGDLRKQADQNGWTPLHVAAYMNRIEPTQLLLKRDRGLAYIKDVEGKTALHIAARRNNSRIMEKIISMCPDCCELVDKKGCNALHDLAAANGRLGESTVEMILKYRSLRSLLNQKDADGNTPLHRHCNSWLMSSPGVDKRLFNKENLNAYQTSLTSENLLTDDEFQWQGIVTPILIAAKNGVTKMVEKILENFPEAVYDLDSSMKNIVLLSVKHKQCRLYGLLLKKKKKVIPDSVFWEVDKEGNTALHLAAKVANSNSRPVPRATFQMNWEIKWFECLYDEKGETPKEIFTKSHEGFVKQGQLWRTSISEQACRIATGLFVAVAFSTSSNNRFNFKDHNLQGVVRPSAVSYSLLIPAASFFFSVVAVLCFLLIICWSYSESSFRTVDRLMVFLLRLAAIYLSVLSTLESFSPGHFLKAIKELDASNYLPGCLTLVVGYYILVLIIPMPFYLRMAGAFFHEPHTMN